MHHRLQFGMRENPASDRRHGSRLAASMKSSLNSVGEEDPETLGRAVVSDDSLARANSSPHAATQADTVGEKRADQLAARQAPAVIERPLTCEEAAALIRVHPKTVKRMARSKELPGHFRFGRWFFYASELDSWMRTELHSVSHP
jgi:excisionase family DNA binding protein